MSLEGVSPGVEIGLSGEDEAVRHPNTKGPTLLRSGLRSRVAPAFTHSQAVVMQTFLPYADFLRSAQVLDDRRLGKQRVEAMQIIRALTRPSYGWQHHPAVLMWRGYEEALGSYAVTICSEWCQRGHADTCEAKILDDLEAAAIPVPPRGQKDLGNDGALPRWLGDDDLHLSHQSALLRKDPGRYGSAFAGVPDNLPYVWPVRQVAR